MSDHSVARVHAAARALVRTQDRWDDALRVPELRDLIPEDVVVQTGTAVCGDTLARWVLPFLDSRSGECTSGEIPVDRTLGESWRWTEQYQPSPDGRPLAAYLADPARGSRGDKDEAVVLCIEPLGLYVAHEGKNRVRFLREQGCPSMGALVRSSPRMSRCTAGMASCCASASARTRRHCALSLASKRSCSWKVSPTTGPRAPRSRDTIWPVTGCTPTGRPTLLCAAMS